MITCSLSWEVAVRSFDFCAREDFVLHHVVLFGELLSLVSPIIPGVIMVPGA